MSKQPLAFCGEVRYFIISALCSYHFHTKEGPFKRCVCNQPPTSPPITLLWPHVRPTASVTNHLVREGGPLCSLLSIDRACLLAYPLISVNMQSFRCLCLRVGVWGPHVNSPNVSARAIISAPHWFETAWSGEAHICFQVNLSYYDLAMLI